jgi:hypothetical protein
MKFDWKTDGDTSYYFRDDDGKVMGMSWKYANQNATWCSKIIIDSLPYNADSEKHLGQYVSPDMAKKAVERYWEIQSRTLLEDR